MDANDEDEEEIFGDGDDDDDDVEVIETDTGFVHVRTSAVEEQATACSLVAMLVQRLQEHFAPYVERTVQVMEPLFDSPQDDVRQFTLTAMPELVRAIGKAARADRAPIASLSSFVVDHIVKTLQKELLFENIITGLQSLKTVIHFSSLDWCDPAYQSSITISEASFSSNCSQSIRVLSVEQATRISTTMRKVLRDSLQRRAVLRAEAQVCDC